MMRQLTILFAAWAAISCGETIDSHSDGAQKLQSPENNDALTNEAGDSGATTAPVPGETSPLATIMGACRPLSVADSERAKDTLVRNGGVGEWTIYNDQKLACSETYLQDRVECELQTGGKVVLEAGDKLLGFENASGGLVSAQIAPSGVVCNALTDN